MLLFDGAFYTVLASCYVYWPNSRAHRLLLCIWRAPRDKLCGTSTRTLP